MYDIKQIKDMLENGGIAVDPGLEERIRSNTMTDSDHAFISRTMATKRELERPYMAKGSLPKDSLRQMFRGKP